MDISHQSLVSLKSIIVATADVDSASENYAVDNKQLTIFFGRDNVKRSKLLAKWKSRGGVMLIGYAAFRNCAIGKTVKEKAVRESFCATLQVIFLSPLCTVT